MLKTLLVPPSNTGTEFYMEPEGSHGAVNSAGCGPGGGYLQLSPGCVYRVVKDDEYHAHVSLEPGPGAATIEESRIEDPA